MTRESLFLVKEGRMTVTFASAVTPTQDRPDKLFLCLLDHAGRVRGANHDIDADVVTSLPDMIRAAHGVLPHPDMPQSVYRRMEDRLASFPASAGYYMCLTKSGQTYWIAVNIYKTPNGRVISHMPVSSPKLVVFQAFFAALAGAERGDTSAEQGVHRLLSTDGINDYRALATQIMVEEISKRDAGRNRAQHRDILALFAMQKTLRDIETFGKKIDGISNRSRLIPYQLKLQASRLEGRHGPLSVVADNHQALTDKLLDVTAQLQQACTTELDPVTDAIAYVAQSNHAAELLEAGQLTLSGKPEIEAAARDELYAILSDCKLQIATLLSNIDSSIQLLNDICHHMRRAVGAMEMTNIMCKIERARLDQEAAGLEGIEEQLHLVQSSLSDWMGRIDANANSALALVDRIKQDKSAGDAPDVAPMPVPSYGHAPEAQVGRAKVHLGNDRKPDAKAHGTAQQIVKAHADQSAHDHRDAKRDALAQGVGWCGFARRSLPIRQTTSQRVLT